MSENVAPVGVIKYLDVNIIEIDDDHNPRLNFDKQRLLSLGKSMQENTQLQAIIVNKIDDVFELVAGERRLRAAIDSGRKTIEAKVFEDLSKLQVTKMMMAENRDRVAFDVLEEAYGYTRLLDLGVSIEEIATSEHCSTDKIKKRLKLLDLQEDVQNLIVRKQNPLPINQALVISKLPQDKQGEVAKKSAPLTGQVASEAMVREMVNDIIGPPLPGIRDDDPDGGGESETNSNQDEGNKTKIEPDKLNPDGPEDSPKKDDNKSKELDKVASEILKLKPVKGSIGVRGSVSIDANGTVYFTKAIVTLNIEGKPDIVSADNLTIGFEGDNLVKVIKQIKKGQPKPAKKKTGKKKVAKNK